MHKAHMGFHGVTTWPAGASGHSQQAGHVMEAHAAQQPESNTNKLRMGCGSGSSSYVENYPHPSAASFAI